LYKKLLNEKKQTTCENCSLPLLWSKLIMGKEAIEEETMPPGE
jgi:hypothetical protein